MAPIDFQSRKNILWESMGATNCLVTNYILENIFFWDI